MFKMSDVGTLSVFRRPRGAAVTDHHREGGTPTNANGLHKDAASSNHDLARLSHYCIARGRARAVGRLETQLKRSSFDAKVVKV